MKLRIFAFVLFASVLILGIGLGFGYFYFNSLYLTPNHSFDSQAFLIKKGDTFSKVSDKLHKNGIIDNKQIFRLFARLEKKDGKLKAGEFWIKSGKSNSEIMDIITSNDIIAYKITFIDGSHSFQIVEKINNDARLAGAKINYPVAEGSLLPETYLFNRGMTKSQMLEKISIAMEEALDKAWQNRDRLFPLKNKHELLILSSIVQKETSSLEERSKVAGVFINRLKRPMRLQSDPTIIYGITKGKYLLNRGLRKSEIAKKTAYNTYIIDGLPPTPICNPSVFFLEATAKPEKHSYYFFVADGSGGHAFAETYSEHRKNVAKWRKIEKQIKK